MRIKDGATYHDVLTSPPEKIAEIVEGTLYLSPRPRIRHSRVGSLLGAELIDLFDRGLRGPGGWWLLFEPELHLGEDVLVPDIAGWRREDLPALPAASAFEIAPDWVCEVLSPSTFDLDMEKKLPAYVRHGVGWLWLVDPEQKRVDVLRREGGTWTVLATHRGDARVYAEPFEQVEIDLTPIWR